MPPASPTRQLTLFDTTCIIVGIIIGAGIFRSPPSIAANVDSAAALLGAFALGGVISFIGALCYAELATTYPREGGDYVFLTRAYGRRWGFLFAWSEFWVVRPGSIGAMAFIFAAYAHELFPLPGIASSKLAYALASVLVLTGIHVLGVNTGKWTQNVLTAVKVIGLLALVAVGLFLTFSHNAPQASVAKSDGGGFRLAMIFVLFTFGGWNDMSYVAAEVREPRKNILRALMLGTVAVTVIYLLVMVALLGSLGFQGVRDGNPVAADVLRIPFGDAGSAAISVLICISCLGAIHGMIFTGARVYYALGTEHRLYAWLGRWNERLQTPLRSLMLQGTVTMLLVAWFGQDDLGFERLVIFTSPLFYFFFLLVGIALLLLRYRDRKVDRPFRVPLYPITPILFCLASLFMLHAGVVYAWGNTGSADEPWYVNNQLLWPLAIMTVGVVASFFDPRTGERGA